MFVFILVHIILCIVLVPLYNFSPNAESKTSEVCTESFSVQRYFSLLAGENLNCCQVSMFRWLLFLQKFICDKYCHSLPYLCAACYWLLLSKIFSESLQIYGFSYCIVRALFLCCDLEISLGENSKQICTSFVSLLSRITVLWFLLFGIYKYSFYVFCPWF